LLASLDVARVIAQDADACLSVPLQAAAAARAGLSQIPSLRVLGLCSFAKEVTHNLEEASLLNSSGAAMHQGGPVGLAGAARDPSSSDIESARESISSSTSSLGARADQQACSDFWGGGAGHDSHSVESSSESSNESGTSTKIDSSLDGSGTRSGSESRRDQAVHARANGSPSLPQNSIAAHDPLRITVSVLGWGRSGFDVAALLEERFHIVPELATRRVSVVPGVP